MTHSVRGHMKFIDNKGYVGIIVRKPWRYFQSDSLFRNSVYLMLSTGVMAGLGFFFWLINAKLFSAEQIGLATTLISTMTLIGSFSLLGTDIGIIRYLPKSMNKSKIINTCLTITVFVSISISIIFLLGLKIFSPRLLFIKENPYYLLLFILFMF